MSDIAKMIAIAKKFGGGSVPSEVVILPETVLKMVDDDGDGVNDNAWFENPLSATPTEGAMCEVSVNGTAYACPAIVFNQGDVSGFALGNTAVVGLADGNADAPFVVMLAPAGIDTGTGEYLYGNISFMDEIPTSVTLSIVQVGGASGGASDSPVFVVKVNNSGGYTADKTYDETLSAMRAGKLVYFMVTAEGLIAATSLVSYFMDKIFATFDQTLNNQKLEWSADGSLKLKT